jgi:hypothetical protein
MNRKSLQWLVLIVFSFAFSTSASAQSVADMYVISTQAGAVNFLSGTATIDRKKGTSSQLLKNDKLKIGDSVTTGADGKVEILLNPGSYLRLAENSQIEFVRTDLDNLEVKIVRGSAIMEVITNSDEGFMVAVNLPNKKAFILTSGVYRFDVSSNEKSQIEVWKGRIQIGTENTQTLRGGNQADISGNSVSVVKFDKGKKDAFEIWSKDRAKQIAAINARLEKRTLTNSLLSAYGRSPFSLYNSYGLWVFDRFSGTYCFLPFMRSGSPYGYGFDRDIWDCPLPPRIIYTPPIYTGGGSTTVKVPDGQSSTPNDRVIRPVDEIRQPRGQRNPFKDNPDFNSNSIPGDRVKDSSNDRVIVPRNDPPTSSPPPSASPSISLPSIEKVKDN